jgi:FKBP-type peptidyl-prolyl cis-trans isomerase
MIRFHDRTTGRSPLGDPISGLVIGLLALAAGAAFAQTTPQSDDEKAFYSIGAGMASQLEMLKPIADRELDLLIQGIRDGVGGAPLAVNANEGRNRVQALVKERQEKALAIEKEAATAFLATEAAREGARKTESGLIYSEIEAGEGASPGATDKVRVHYHGTLRDGTVFDSSVERGELAEFPLNRVIACWTEGVAMMKVGGKSRLVCPASIAYGDRSTGRIPPGAALVFEVELIEIVP